MSMHNDEMADRLIAEVARLKADLAAARAERDQMVRNTETLLAAAANNQLVLHSDLAAARELLKLARSEVELWIPDECNCAITDEILLNRWYALRDRIDAAIAGKKK